VRRPLFFALAPALLLGCVRQDDYVPPQQGYPSQGQWAPQQATPLQQPYSPQGQWVPTPAPPPPAPWWQPQPGAFPFPGLPPQGQTPPLPTFPTTFPSDAAQSCVNTVNQHRATQSLPPLQRWLQSETCAAGQARDGAATGQPHGTFGRCAEQGQNVCPAWPGPTDRMIAPCIQSMWNEGPGADFAAHGHYINLSSARFTRVACGFYTAPSGQVSLVQDFQ